MATIPSPDCTSVDFIRDPYATLAVLRDQDPVHWHTGLKSWCLTRHDDVATAFRDDRFSADRIRSFVGSRNSKDSNLELLGDCIGLWMVFNDPPVHTRLRKLTSRVFTRWSLERIARPVIVRRVDALLDKIADSDEFDFIESFAWPLPSGVIADLLGVPEQHLDALKVWSDDLAAFVLDSRIQEDKYATAARGLANMNALFDEIIAESRTANRQGDDANIIDQLVLAHDESDRLSRQELAAFCVLLLFAGHETTAHFLATGLRALINHPGESEILRNRQDDIPLLNNAVNEMLRFDGPILAISRTALEDVELRGQKIKEGDRMYLFNASANRDERVFHESNRFSVTRDDASRMVGFGYGIHLCLGIHLARLEGAIAFSRILKRFGDFEITGPMPDWTNTLVMRGPKKMPVRFKKR